MRRRIHKDLALQGLSFRVWGFGFRATLSYGGVGEDLVLQVI